MNRLTKRSENGIGIYTEPSCEPEKWERNRHGVLQKLAEYEDLEEQGLLIKLPCKVGDTVYIIEKCENIDGQLDGTLWDDSGYYGTATGYYCPYEGCCPHNTDDCESVKSKQVLFDDMVTGIFATEEKEGEFAYMFENCKGKETSDFGKTVFLTREEAEKALGEV